MCWIPFRFFKQDNSLPTNSHIDDIHINCFVFVLPWCTHKEMWEDEKKNILILFDLLLCFLNHCLCKNQSKCDVNFVAVVLFLYSQQNQQQKTTQKPLTIQGIPMYVYVIARMCFIIHTTRFVSWAKNCCFHVWEILFFLWMYIDISKMIGWSRKIDLFLENTI